MKDDEERAEVETVELMGVIEPSVEDEDRDDDANEYERRKDKVESEGICIEARLDANVDKKYLEQSQGYSASVNPTY